MPKFTYADPNGAWSEDLGAAVVRLGSISGLAGSADVGGTAAAQLSFDDPDGTAGHSSDALTGWKFIFVDEPTAASGNQRIAPYLVGAREYTHASSETDSLRTGVSRHIETELKGINELLSLAKLTGSDANRPAESPAARLSWILSSAYLSAYVDDDTTYVVTASGPTMEANDYRPSGSPMDVISDCCLATGFNAFLIWADETATKPILFFDNFSTSTAYTTDYRLSNVLAHIDSFPNGTIGATKTFSFANAKLRRDPERVGSEVAVPHRKGWIDLVNAPVAATFISRGLIAPTQSVKSDAAATTLGRKLLKASATELDTLSGSVQVPAAYVNVFREGQRASVEDRTAPGYSGFNDWRILDRTVRQDDQTTQLYTIDLTLVATVTADCSTDYNLDGTVTAGVTLDAGTTTLAHGAIQGWFGIIPPDDAVSTIPIANPTNANDGNVTTYSNVAQYVLRGAGTVSANWYSDLGGPQTICSMRGTQEIGSNSWRSRAPDAIYSSDDGSTWTPVGWHLSFTRLIPDYWIATFGQLITAQYWRLAYTETVTTTLIDGLWNWMPLGLRVYDWKIIG